jgi:hypothetical protein
MTAARLCLVLLVPAFLPSSLNFASAQNLSGVPVKIQITPVQDSGGRRIKVDLLDPSNQPARAKKDFNVGIATRAYDGSTGKSVVAIKQGEMSATTELPLEHMAGIVEVRATSAHLADGGAVVKVSSADQRVSPPPTSSALATATPSSTPRHIERAVAPPAGAAPSASPLRGLAGVHTEHIAEALRRRASEIGQLQPGETAASAAGSRAPASISGAAPPSLPSPTAGPVATSTGPSSLPAASGNPVVQFDYYPKTRKLRADGDDFATVWAVAPDIYSATTDFQICFRSDLGPLTPEPIKIAKGGTPIGEARFVSKVPGTIKVWYIWSLPPTQRPDSPLTIEFTYPVWQPKLVPQQNNVSLFDSVEVGVELADKDGNSLPADTDRPVYISIGSGAGELSPTEVKLAPNESRKMIRFTPTRPGRIHLVASSPTLPEGGGEIVVKTPWGLLGLGALGSLLGALLAYWTKKGEKTRNRFIIGLITGLVLYWAALFLGSELFPKLPHAAIVNPYTAVVLPLIGGWIGTPILAWLGKKLGMAVNLLRGKWAV